MIFSLPSVSDNINVCPSCPTTQVNPPTEEADEDVLVVFDATLKALELGLRGAELEEDACTIMADSVDATDTDARLLNLKQF